MNFDKATCNLQAF